MASGTDRGDVLYPPVETGGKITGLAAPYVRRAVRQLYGLKAEDPQLCPGEAHCDIFQGTAGKTRAIKERKACKGERGPKDPPVPCPMLLTKTDEGRAEHASLVELAQRALTIRREVRSGYPRPRERMANIEFQAYQIASECCEGAEWSQQEEIRTMLGAALGMRG